MRLPSRRGVGLVDILAAIPVAAILLLILTQFYRGSQDAMAAISAQATLQSDLTLAMKRLMTDVRLAKIQEPTGSICHDGRYPVTTNTLCLWVPGINAQGQPLDNAAFIRLATTAGVGLDWLYYSFDPATGVLTRREFRDSTGLSVRGDNVSRVVSTGLTGMTCTPAVTSGNNTMQSIECTLSGSRTARGRTYVASLTTRGRLRNF